MPAIVVVRPSPDHGDAITPEDMVPAEWQNYTEINAAYFRKKAA